jgi:hypothetical protein
MTPAELIVMRALDEGERQGVDLGQLGLALVVGGVLLMTRKTPEIALDVVDRIVDECRSEHLQNTPSAGSA